MNSGQIRSAAFSSLGTGETRRGPVRYFFGQAVGPLSLALRTTGYQTNRTLVDQFGSDGRGQLGLTTASAARVTEVRHMW